MQAGQEGELRGVASTAGRAQLLNQQQQNQIRMGMSQELQGLQRAAAAEESRLQGARARLNLAEATGFQGMAADARARQQALNQAGAQGLVNVGTQAMKLAPLYSSGGDSISSTSVGDQMVSNKLIENSPTRFATNPAGEIVNTFEVFQADNIFTPLEAVTMPAINPTPLSQQYDSVTGRLIQ